MFIVARIIALVTADLLQSRRARVIVQYVRDEQRGGGVTVASEMIYLRASAAVVVSWVILLVYEYIYERSFAGRQPPLYWVVLIIVASLSLRIGSFLAGGLAGISLLGVAFPRDGVDAIPLAVATACGGLLGIWAATILLQVGQNMVRSSMGLRKRPIRWLRSTRWKSKSAGR